MKWAVTDAEALDAGFTHEASYWGLPVLVGNLEFCEHEPLMVTTKYHYTDWLFSVLAVVELIFAPYIGGRFKITRELKA